MEGTSNLCRVRTRNKLFIEESVARLVFVWLVQSCFKYSLRLYLIIVVGVRNISLTRFVENMCNIYILK